MKILVINAGSSSLKYQLIEMENEAAIAKGIVERIGQKCSTLMHKGSKNVTFDDLVIPTHTEAVKTVLDALLSSEYGVIKSVSEISAVGHRVVHGGEDFSESVLLTEEAMVKIAGNTDLAPLHQPANIIGIRACQAVMPNVPHAGIFDTTFHATIPDYAYMYAVAYDDYKSYRLRRYGFHGTSHMFIAGECKKLLGGDKNLVICHLGNGASISAVKGGKCIDTSMGLTPLEGLMMGTRSGDIDTAAVDYLCDKTGLSVKGVIDYLNKKCGLLGVSGVSSDFRDLRKAIGEGNTRADLALWMFCYRIKKYIGSFAAALGGVDCIVFTGGIGENAALVRQRVMTGLEYLGVTFKNEVNDNPSGGIYKLSSGKTDVYIIPTNEELVIARETARLAF
ncbi:MAG: acetate kinase [Firmicutes bacterium]|nr:acetate kinase [Bacillota bacterium]